MSVKVQHLHLRQSTVQWIARIPELCLVHVLSTFLDTTDILYTCIGLGKEPHRQLKTKRVSLWHKSAQRLKQRAAAFYLMKTTAPGAIFPGSKPRAPELTEWLDLFMDSMQKFETLCTVAPAQEVRHCLWYFSSQGIQWRCPLFVPLVCLYISILANL